MAFWLLLTVLMTCAVSSYISFEDYKAKYGKVYHPSEERYRMNVLKHNLRMINDHNNGQNGWKLGVNHLSDLSPREFRRILGTRVNFREYRRHDLSQRCRLHTLVLPEIADWREKGVLTPVKNQGLCGSCWAFSAVEGVESHHVIARRNQGSYAGLIELSEQQILDCTVIPGGGGCDGGYEDSAYETMMKRGASTEWTYPYMSFFGDRYSCNATRTRPVVQVANFEVLPPNSYNNMVSALASVGPIEVVVDASEWSAYESGIFDGCSKSTVELNHAVQLVGMGKEGNVEYWIVRNSWGVEWGEQGFIRLLKSSNFTCGRQEGVKVCGTCGILYRGNYPVVKL